MLPCMNDELLFKPQTTPISPLYCHILKISEISHYFSCSIICTIWLIVDKGQALLLAYMLVIVSNGPIENFNYNTQVLATSALCAQENVLKSTAELMEYLQRPLQGDSMCDRQSRYTYTPDPLEV